MFLRRKNSVIARELVALLQSKGPIEVIPTTRTTPEELAGVLVSVYYTGNLPLLMMDSYLTQESVQFLNRFGNVRRSQARLAKIINTLVRRHVLTLTPVTVYRRRGVSVAA